MKKIYYIILVSLLIVSCEDLFEGVNNDPNNPISAPYDKILTGAEVGNIILQTGETARRAGIFAGYYTGIDRQHLGFSQYTVTTSDFDAIWDDAFVNTLRNAKVAKQSAIDAGITGVTIGITQTLEAMAFGTATSLYGDIPFDEAIFEIENPVFEDQTAVYGKIQNLLDEAITNLQLGTGRPPSGSDIYLDGDPQKWIQIANTLKARYYMHTREYPQAYAAAQNGINASANGLYGPHGSGLDESNLSYQFFGVYSRAADLIVSDFMTSLVAPTAVTNPDFANYRGNAKTDETGRYGYYFQVQGVGVQPNTVDGLAAQTASAALATYEENLLILAEAGFRSSGFNTGLQHLNEFRAYMDAGGYLTNANASNVQYDQYTALDFANGGIENPDNQSADNALLREILQERYVTLFGQIEGFNDTRRTENESIVRVPLEPNVGAQLPQRFIYPQSEIDRNSNIPNPIPNFFSPTKVNQ
ncbi:SusD/RagB family nutrient-binding outer membrane lipoprotein [uncultured Roseivirga sp.]|uniref:SusD/RagB family nutrient-binding outer membrane lipoprotein n=1 Tax=uncultured Roseivirga sp. TaxID=543088 RepID=UPI0030D8D74E|tara:strand:- start:1311 stop:2729 length:1419 start_codon:yes stop_codon:yes gene_type:complete